jgi:hypothetical protein
MEIFMRTLVNFLFYTNVPYYLLCLAGIWAVLWFLVDNFKSVVQIVKGVLLPYFQPEQENKTLVEKYGKWAGKFYEKIFCVLFVQFAVVSNKD